MNAASALFPQLRERSHEPELMDGAGLQDAALHARCLADLAAVNRVTAAHRPVLQFLSAAWSAWPLDEPLSVLDVGSGQGDLLRAIRALADREGRDGSVGPDAHASPRVQLTGLDLHPDSTAAADAATPPSARIRYLTGDLFDHDERYHFIVSSQLAHHLDDGALRRFVQWLDATARCGWCIADLRRHWFPYFGFRWLARVAGWHRVVRLDGTRSIARSCTPAEWAALLAAAGVADAGVHRHAPFRLSVRKLAADCRAGAAAVGR